MSNPRALLANAYNSKEKKISVFLSELRSWKVGMQDCMYSHDQFHPSRQFPVPYSPDHEQA